MDRSIDQLCAAAKLIGACEHIAEHGYLNEGAEMMLRECIAEARSAFQLYQEVEEAA